MTIPADQDSVSKWVGNGVADTFNYEFKITTKTDLLVITTDLSSVDTTLTVDVDYSVAGVSDDAGGSITLTAGALTDQFLITISDNIPISQSIPFSSQSAFFSILHENAFDKLTRLINRLLGRDEKVIRIKGTDQGSADLTLPHVVDRNSKYISFDVDGNVVMDDAPTLAAAAAAAAALVSENAAAAAAAAALVSENAAAADVVLTNADVVSTGNDLTATNQDTIDTAADVVLTNADVVSTGNDLTATNQDTIDTAADVVSAGISATNASNSATDAAASASSVEHLFNSNSNLIRWTPADIVANITATSGMVVTEVFNTFSGNDITAEFNPSTTSGYAYIAYGSFDNNMALEPLFSWSRVTQWKIKVRIDRHGDTSGNHQIVMGNSTVFGDANNSSIRLVFDFSDTANTTCRTINSVGAMTNTVVTAAYDNALVWEIIYRPGIDVRFYLNDSLVATHTTNIPASGNAIGKALGVTTTSASGAETYIGGFNNEVFV